MNITQEQKNFIENLIKECQGYKGSEHLLNEFYNEVIRRAYSIVSKQNELNNAKIYLKRIANAAIMDIKKNAANQSLLNNSNNENSDSLYEFDENGDIELNYDISFEHQTKKETHLSEEIINQIKEIVIDIDENNSWDQYKNIFELRYLNNLTNSEIAKKLEIKEIEVDKKLLFMLSKIKKEVLTK